jgi:hypothetical protein
MMKRKNIKRSNSFQDAKKVNASTCKPYEENKKREIIV